MMLYLDSQTMILCVRWQMNANGGSGIASVGELITQNFQHANKPI